MNPSADLSPPALAALIAELIERLELGPVTLVGNDTGGALCQLVCTNHPQPPVQDAERLASLFGEARLERVEGARTFVQLDAPEQLAALITGA